MKWINNAEDEEELKTECGKVYPGQIKVPVVATNIGLQHMGLQYEGVTGLCCHISWWPGDLKRGHWINAKYHCITLNTPSKISGTFTSIYFQKCELIITTNSSRTFWDLFEKWQHVSEKKDIPASLFRSFNTLKSCSYKA